MQNKYSLLTSRTSVATLLALLPILYLLVWALVVRGSQSATEIIAIIVVRYGLAVVAAAILVWPFGLLFDRNNLARLPKGLAVFLGLLNTFVLTHIIATISVT